METERALAELQSRVDGLETDLGSRIAVLEHQVTTLERVIAPPPSANRPGQALPTTAAPPPPSPPSSRPTIAAPPAAVGAPPPQAADSPPPAVGSPPPPLPGMPPPPLGQTGTPAGPPPARSPRTPSFEVGVEALLRWAGIVLVVLSAIFLVSTAISRGWIGPELQLLGATAIGFGLLGAAVRLVESHRGYARTFGIGGAVVIIVCAGAAYSWLDLYSALTGLGLVAVAAAVSVLVAARLRMESVAVTSTAAMLIVPTLARILADAPVLATGIWLGLFTIVATAVGLERGWVLYRVVSTWAAALWVFGLAAILSSDNNTEHIAAGVALVTVVGLALWLHPLLADRRAATADRSIAPASSDPAMALLGFEHRSAVLVPLWSWTSALLFAGLDFDVPGGWIGLVAAAGFVLLAALAGPLERWISDEAFGSHLVGAGLLVTVSAVAWLGGPVLIVFLAGQAVTTLVLAQVFSDRWLKVNAYLLAGLAWLMLVFELAEGLDVGSQTAEEHVANGVVVALFGLLAWLTARAERSEFSEVVTGLAWLSGVGFLGSVLEPHIQERDWLFVGVVLSVVGLAAASRLGSLVLWISAAIGALSVVGAVVSIVNAAESGADLAGHLANLSVVAALAGGTYLMWLVEKRMELARPLLIAAWLGVLGWLASVLLAAPQGQVAVSAAWAVAACVALLAGIRTNESVVRFLGLGTLGVVLAKLLTVDLAEVDTLWRVGLFLVIGLGLLRLGYVLPALAERYGPDDEAPPPPSPPPSAEVPMGGPGWPG